MKKKVIILDTTLRDGSYAVGFQFSALDTAVIAQALERVGVIYVEIGHGVGLGASRSGFGEAASSDEAYFQAVADVLTQAQYGMFCIPGIAKLEDVDLAADMGASFLRIGTNVTEVPQSKPFIERAKARGLFVSANFMKSYALPPEQFAENAKLSKSYGSDLICVVDSAGSMLASEVRNYFQAVRDTVEVDLGFHGHNNLGLAVSHSLLAVELGATMIDGSLQGLGRSSGNAATELLVATLDRMGRETGIDLLGVMDVGEKLVRPLIETKGLSSLDITMGYAQFHSSYMGIIRKFANKERVDPRKLIIELCKHDKINAPEELVGKIAASINEKVAHALISTYIFTRYHGNEQTPIAPFKTSQDKQ